MLRKSKDDSPGISPDLISENAILRDAVEQLVKKLVKLQGKDPFALKGGCPMWFYSLPESARKIWRRR